MKKGGGRTANKKVLLYEGVERSVCFIQNFADSSTTPLPGRITGLERADIRLLPTTETNPLSGGNARHRRVTPVGFD